MNIERMERLAKMLEELTPPTPDLGFNLGVFIALEHDREATMPDMTDHGCGTVACIAGWAVIDALAQTGCPTPIQTANIIEAGEGHTVEDAVGGLCAMLGVKTDYLRSADIEYVAQEILDLDPDQAHALFVPVSEVVMNKITPAQAAQAIRNMIESGSPRWDEVVKGTSADLERLWDNEDDD